MNSCSTICSSRVSCDDDFTDGTFKGYCTAVVYLVLPNILYSVVGSISGNGGCVLTSTQDKTSILIFSWALISALCQRNPEAVAFALPQLALLSKGCRAVGRHTHILPCVLFLLFWSSYYRGRGLLSSIRKYFWVWKNYHLLKVISNRQHSISSIWFWKRRKIRLLEHIGTPIWCRDKTYQKK